MAGTTVFVTIAERSPSESVADEAASETTTASLGL